MDVYNVVIEVTRRCNLDCPHCLRGDVQPLTMSEEFVRDFLKPISYISTVTFSGGEPSLPSGIKGIERTLDWLDRWRVDVGSFYIATNGKRLGESFRALIRRLYFFCSDNETSRVDISNDKWHSDTPRYLSDELESLNYELQEDLVGFKMPSSPQWEPQVIREGRAVGWGNREYEGDELLWREYEYNGGGLELHEGAVYLNCKGNVVTGCDFSYKSQDDPGNILCKASEFGADVVRANCTNEN